MSRKKILFLSSWYPSKVNPNLGNFVQRHAEAANELTDVTALFVTSSSDVDRYTLEKETINGVATYVAYYPKINGNIPFLSKFKKYSAYLNAAARAFKEIGKEFDLVHLNIAYPAGLFALALKKNESLPYVMTEQWTGYLSIKGEFEKLSKIQKVQYAKIFRNSSRVLAVSGHLGDALKAHGLVSDFEILHNAVDHNVFFPATEKQQKFRFIHVSSFDDAHKNVSGMFRVLQQLNQAGIDFEIHIVTEGSREEVERLAQKFDIHPSQLLVDCSLDRYGVADALRSAHCLVLFSNYETFSVVLAEAWMTGIPCVYSKCGGLTEIDDPKLGIQVPVRGEERLYEALAKIAKRELPLKEAEIAAFAADFRIEKIARKMDGVYSEVLKNAVI